MEPGRETSHPTLITAGLERVRRSRSYPEGRITHHHGDADHAAFLERPFLEALAALEQRIDRVRT
ncbi:MAG TPA: hypothetical protein VGS60_01445 [Actinomycetes bacterium]|nr:hypothetical protein [Actinomycetes bacterium]